MLHSSAYHLSIIVLKVAHYSQSLQEVTMNSTATLHITCPEYVFFRFSRLLAILVLIVLVLYASNVSNPIPLRISFHMSMISFTVDFRFQFL